MAPVAVTTETTTTPAPGVLKLRAQDLADAGKSRLEGPMKYNGRLDSYPVSPLVNLADEAAL